MTYYIRKITFQTVVLISLLATPLCFVSAREPDTIPIQPEQELFFLARGATYSIQSVPEPFQLNSFNLDSFQPTNTDAINMGFVNQDIWFWSRVQNLSNQDRNFVIQTASTDTRCYSFQRVTPSDILIQLPFWIPESWYINFAITLKANATVDIFTRCQATGNLGANLEMMTPREYHRINTIMVVINSFFYGAMFIIFLYNLLVFLSLKERAYLDYLVFLIFSILFQTTLDGTAWRLIPGWGITLNYYIAIFTAIIAPIFLIRYTRLLLDTRQLMPGWDRILIFLMFMLALMAIAAPFLQLSVVGDILTPVVVLSPGILFFIGILAYRRQHSIASIFLAAIGFNLCGFSILIADLAGFEIFDPHLIAGRDVLKASTMIEVSILALALGVKINRFRDEALQAQANLIDQKRKHTIELENKVAERTRELQDSNRIKDKFLFIISHDLKTSMGNLAIIFEDLIIDDQPIDPELLGSLRSTTQSSYDVLNDLLTWYMSQQGILSPQPEDLQVSEICASTIKFINQRISQKKISLSIDCSPELYVYADGSMLRTILRNLLTNAVKFTMPGGQIHLLCRQIKNLVRIEIQDNGIGMPDSVAANLFLSSKRKSSTQGTHQESGSGLGLILCQELVALNNGKIGVESNLKLGTTFWVELPLVGMIPLPGTPEILFQDLGDLNALVVEDNPLNQKTIQIALESLGISCKIVNDGETALQNISRNEYSIYFLDIHLPGIDGFQVAREIRKLYPSTLIIALSPLNPESLPANPDLNLLDGFLSKPLETDMLREMLRNKLY